MTMKVMQRLVFGAMLSSFAAAGTALAGGGPAGIYDYSGKGQHKAHQWPAALYEDRQDGMRTQAKRGAEEDRERGSLQERDIGPQVMYEDVR